jgi:hypothetical protein
MLQKYKEIFYGILFGLGACTIDTVMHARMENTSFWIEMLQPQPAMIFYRALFILFGVALGWLLWQKNKRERDFRHLAETVEKFHRDLCTPALLMHTRLQLLLTTEDFHLSPEAAEAIHFAYDRSREIQTLAKEKLSPPSTG